jgi:hypothetical protein
MKTYSRPSAKWRTIRLVGTFCIKPSAIFSSLQVLLHAGIIAQLILSPDLRRGRAELAFKYSNPALTRFVKRRSVFSASLSFSDQCSLLNGTTMADVPTLSITLLGAGQEVGRSCCVLQYRDITIVLDAGVHPAHTGMASLPFIDELDWSTVDAILVTQYAPSSPSLFELGVLNKLSVSI